MTNTSRSVRANKNSLIEERFATKRFRQTRGGLYLCGINWGGDETDEMASIVRRRRSFFSDDNSGRYPYRERILKWFALWGFELARVPELAGDLELSISQTNWLKDRSKRSEHRTQPKYLLEHLDEFLEVVRARRPRVIFLYGSCLGVALQRALKQTATLRALERLLGPLESPMTETARNEPGEPGFKLRMFTFAGCRILCFPHPTGAKGVTNAQMARYAPEVREALRFLQNP